MTRTVPMAILIGWGLMFGSACADEERELTKAFNHKSAVRIHTVSGDCIVKRATNDTVKVHLKHAYKPASTFEPVFSEDGDQLVIKEAMHGSNSGWSMWTLAVPAGTTISFESASGRFELSDMEATVTARTASGDVTVRGFELKGASAFTSASGDVSVVLAKTARFDLDVTSASGSAVLNYSGNPLQGLYEFKVKDSRGTIRSPAPFEHEEEIVQDGEKYLSKSFHRGSDTPRIRIHSASGEAVLLEK